MYTIIDEPKPGKWEHLATSPFWPLLGLMLGGGWLGFTWFVFNAIAMGCPERGKTIGLALCGLAGALAIGLGIGWFIHLEILDDGNIRYALLTITVWKLWIGYRLFILQSGTFHLFEYFGGSVKSGLLPLMIGMLVGRKFVLGLVASPLWIFTMG
ncbi:MAG: hypothetical protein GY859_33980 [Desulfobacterales bacterium]|nr:hypothetical protein [Desulfobacterales bacterium]